MGESSHRHPFAYHDDRDEKDLHKTWRPLRFLNHYRLTLAAVFVLLHHLVPGKLPPPLGAVSSHLFYNTSIAYLAFSLVAMFFIARRSPSFDVQRNTHIFADIAFITVLMHSSGGITNGLGMLLVISIANGSMIARGRGPLFFASVASLAVLGEQTFVFFTHSDTAINYTQAGLLGITLFATAILAHVLASRARESEALAMQRSLDLANMAQLTEYVIQQVQTGTLVVDNNLRVRLINGAGWKLLGTPVVKRSALLNQYSPELQQRLLAWQRDGRAETGPLVVTRSRHHLFTQFLPIGTEERNGTLIFLEDASTTTQQAQQLKLASLGRLTASIAHEIRNPLGAITHATALLAEAQGLSSADLRLCEIIQQHSQRINRIIEDVLQLGRRDQSHAEQFELGAWLERFIEEFLQGQQQPSGAVTWQQEEPITIHFDPNHLRQILTNLCQNGLRYAAPEKLPRLRLHCGFLDERRSFLDIFDSGPGITAKDRAHIFEPFFTTERSGTGLGLYIAKELAEYNQTQLLYEPDEQGTSRFRLLFPRQQTQISQA